MLHTPDPEAPARVLALLVAANGQIDPRELAMLEELDGFARLGVSRDRFVALAQDGLREFGAQMREFNWLRLDDRLYIDRLLDAVPDQALRLLVCRLAAAVVTADGQVSDSERRVYDHLLLRWGISASAVTEAILHEHPVSGGPVPLG